MAQLASYIAPAVIAAFVSGVVSVVGFIVSGRTARRIHREKLAFDEKQAERRVTAEIDILARKVSADIAFAEKKAALDQALVVWRRRYELAEEVLTAAYEARSALDWARARGIFEGEGRTRIATEPESEALREARNTAFVPLERLASQAKIFAVLQALQDKLVAHFGVDAVKPVHILLEVNREISVAASILLQHVNVEDGCAGRIGLQSVRDTLYGQRPDASDRKLDTAIEELEAVCRPVLAGTASA